MTRNIFIAFCLVLVALSCSKQDTEYKFFVAGHAYGDPNIKRIGFHPPFADYTKKANQDELMKIGFLTGDFLKNYETEKFPNAALDGIAKFDFPIHPIAGNHELLGDYKKYFGDFFYTKRYGEDLFLMLTPGLDNWNITGKQLDFLKETLKNEGPSTRHTFIMLHELIWWSPTNEYRNVKINYLPLYPGSSNFDSIITPILLDYKKPITIFAGDLGATAKVTPLMYHVDQNLTLIASGMGSWKYDHVLEVSISADNIVYDIVPIGEAEDLGRIYDYGLSK